MPKVHLVDSSSCCSTWLFVLSYVAVLFEYTGTSFDCGTQADLGLSAIQKTASTLKQQLDFKQVLGSYADIGKH